MEKGKIFNWEFVVQLWAKVQHFREIVFQQWQCVHYWQVYILEARQAKCRNLYLYSGEEMKCWIISGAIKFNVDLAEDIEPSAYSMCSVTTQERVIYFSIS